MNHQETLSPSPAEKVSIFNARRTSKVYIHLWDQDKPLRCQPLIGTLCHGKLTPLIEARKNNLLKYLGSVTNPMSQLWSNHNQTKAPIPTGFSVWKFLSKDYWLWMNKSSIECGNEAFVPLSILKRKGTVACIPSRITRVHLTVASAWIKSVTSTWVPKSPVPQETAILSGKHEVLICHLISCQ